MARILSQRSFRAIGVATIAAVYFLILVGGIVRASGSGMGCPDWPKCFGQWVPPTDVSQLPANYQEVYAERGYADTEFNALKTWTEYLNRLTGVSIGLFVLATVAFSLSYWTFDKSIVGASVVSLFLVGFNGWLGAVIVKSNLEPVIITGHMIAALLTVGALVYAVARSYRRERAAETLRRSRALPALIALVLALSLIQLVMGTQVREHVDEIAKNLGEPNRAAWPSQFGVTFLVHRTFSLAVLAANLSLASAIFRAASPSGGLRRWAVALIAVIVLEIFVGALLYYAGMPAVLQPLHLLLSAILFGIQFYILIAYRMARQTVNAGGDDTGLARTR